MMLRMRPAPIVIGCKRQDADSAAGPVIDAPARKERTVATIMLDHEQTQKKRRRGNDEDKAQPEAKVNGCPCPGPQQRKWDGRHREFDKAASGTWLAIPGEDFEPCFFVEKRRRWVVVDGLTQKTTPRAAMNANKARAITAADPIGSSK